MNVGDALVCSALSAFGHRPTRRMNHPIRGVHLPPGGDERSNPSPAFISPAFIIPTYNMNDPTRPQRSHASVHMKRFNAVPGCDLLWATTLANFCSGTNLAPMIGVRFVAATLVPASLTVTLLAVGCGGAQATAKAGAKGRVSDVVASNGEVVAEVSACERLPLAKDDWPKQVRGYRRLCDTWSIEFCVEAGWSLMTGEDGMRDWDSSVPLFECACAGGSVRGCNALGTMYEHGQGVEKDMGRAVALYRQACDRDFGEGCTNWGAVLQYGRNGPKEPDQAALLFEKGCELNSADGCAGLGYLLSEGLGVTRDRDRALELFAQSCDDGSATGCNNLGYAHEVGDGRPKDHEQALEYYEEACASGFPPGCQNLGLMHLYGRGTRRDAEKAASNMKRGCDAWEDFGREEVCVRMARLVEQGKASVIGVEEALGILESGCENEVSVGCLGAAHYHLTSTPPDVQQAKRFLTLGCELDEQRACKALEQVKNAGGK